MAEAKFFSRDFEVLKLLRRDVALDLKLAIGRLEILPDGHDIDIVLAQVVKRRHDFVG